LFVLVRVIIIIIMRHLAWTTSSSRKTFIMKTIILPIALAGAINYYLTQRDARENFIPNAFFYHSKILF
jgi:hypothetical protein